MNEPVPQTPTTILDELLAAARGLVAIVSGDRRAPSWFDFTRRGLAGSFIALLVATAVSAYLPTLNSDAGYGNLPPSRLLLMAIFLFAIQLGFSALVLRQIGRLEVLVPYLVADNWATFFITLGSTILTLLGIAGDAVVVVVGLLVLLVEINIARLIMTLSPWQIAALLVAQLVGVTIGLFIVGMFLPLPADALAQ
ncbi:MAG TPA: hypothetical protein VHB74_09240 [Devosia sp.]|nr:hypothetical protein [Devosia sp.]